MTSSLTERSSGHQRFGLVSPSNARHRLDRAVPSCQGVRPAFGPRLLPTPPVVFAGYARPSWSRRWLDNGVSSAKVTTPLPKPGARPHAHPRPRAGPVSVNVYAVAFGVIQTRFGLPQSDHEVIETGGRTIHVGMPAKQAQRMGVQIDSSRVLSDAEIYQSSLCPPQSSPSAHRNHPRSRRLDLLAVVAAAGLCKWADHRRERRRTRRYELTASSCTRQ
jgi:hypothetical protein